MKRLLISQALIIFLALDAGWLAAVHGLVPATAAKQYSYLCSVDAYVNMHDGTWTEVPSMPLFLSPHLDVERDIDARCLSLNTSAAECRDGLFRSALLRVEQEYATYLGPSGDGHYIDITRNETVLHLNFKSVSGFDGVCTELEQDLCRQHGVQQFYKQVWSLYTNILSDALGRNFIIGSTLDTPPGLVRFGLQELWDEELMLSKSVQYCRERHGAETKGGALTGCLGDLHHAVHTYGECLQETTYRRHLTVGKRLLFLEHVFDPGDPILFIGGNTGEDLKYLLQKIPGVTVYIFEPLELYANYLKETYKDNPLVRVFNVGMGSGDGSACFGVDGQNGDATMQIKDTFSAVSDVSAVSGAGSGASGNIECAKVVNASRFVLEDLSSPTGRFAVHMNCEGCEYDVLDSWVGSGVIRLISSLQFASHAVEWVPDVKDRYCRLRDTLAHTHDIDFSEAWCWERWLPLGSRWDTTLFSISGEVPQSGSSANAVIAPFHAPGAASARRGVAVYTVYCSRVPATFVPRAVKGVPSYFLTDNSATAAVASAMGWSIIDIPGPPYHDDAPSNMKCKLPKTQPHLFHALDTYKFLAYVDHALVPKLYNFFEWGHLLHLLEGPGSFSMLAFKSETNHNIVAEFQGSMAQERYSVDAARYVNYINARIAEGFQGGVILRGGFSVRNMDHSMTRVIGAAWYSEILRCGIQDQLSLAYVFEQYAQYIGVLYSYRLSTFW
jgi:FkbM family methyltransferase